MSESRGPESAENPTDPADRAPAAPLWPPDDQGTDAEEAPDLSRLVAPRSRRAPLRVRVGVGAAAVLVAAAVAAVIVVVVGGDQGQTTTVSTVTASTAAPDIGGGDAEGGGSGAGAAPTPTAAAQILVHVAGAVHSPGLYRLAAGSRVVDAVAAAGGFTHHAVRSGVNLARRVADGEQLVVPSDHGTAPSAGAAASASGNRAAGAGAATTGPVDLNTATAEQLETLPRIGPAMAARILAWRTAHGGFTRIEQLMDVSGIGQKTFDGLKDLVTV